MEIRRRHTNRFAFAFITFEMQIKISPGYRLLNYNY